MKSIVSLTKKNVQFGKSGYFAIRGGDDTELCGSSLEGVKADSETTFTSFLPMTTCIASTYPNETNHVKPQLSRSLRQNGS